VKTIHNDLVQIVSSPEGTAYNPRIDNLPPLAGKTGTAELKEKQGEKGKEDGWFVAFNTNQPSLEIAMMIEGVQDKGGSHYVVGKVKNAFHTLLK
jgi:penicillin-binding protein